MAHITTCTGERLANQDCLDCLEAHLVHTLRRSSLLRVQPQVCGLNMHSPRHQNSAFDSMVELAHITRPAILQHHLKRSWLETLNWPTVPCGVSRHKVASQRGNILT